MSKGENSYNPEEAVAIRQACLDYVEGFFESNEERVQRGVHPDLAKRSIGEDGMLSNMTRDTLIGYAINQVWKKPAISVEIFDISGNIAAALITSDFVDYVQLAKLDGEWKIVNVLWR